MEVKFPTIAEVLNLLEQSKDDGSTLIYGNTCKCLVHDILRDTKGIKSHVSGFGMVKIEDEGTEEQQESAIEEVQLRSDALQFRLKDNLEMDDLKQVKGILEKYPGDKPVILNLLVEGRRQNIDTGLLVEDIVSMRQDMGPYVEG